MNRHLLLLTLLLPLLTRCQDRRNSGDVEFVKSNYDKQEVYIPMRDGVRLYTVVYTPKDHSRPYPFLMCRTPYSSGPYGDTVYKRSLGPDSRTMYEKYIFVYQDVRGRYMSEGEFQEMTPAKDVKKGKEDTTKAPIPGTPSTGC